MAMLRLEMSRACARQEMTALACVLLACALTGGCGDDDGPTLRDAGPVMLMDSGRQRDVGPTVPVDAGPREDSGGGGVCPSTPCNIQTAEGCEPGDGCYFASEGEGMEPMLLCAMAGTMGDAEPCTNVNDCRDGFGCASDGPTGTGVCRAYCCAVGSTAGCPDGQSCAVTIGDSDIGFCRRPDTCDPLAQTGCSEGQGCYVQDLENGGVICIASTDNKPAGEECDTLNSCAPGHMCVRFMASETTRCYEMCDTTATTSGCPDNFSCQSTGSDAFPAMGLCRMNAS